MSCRGQRPRLGNPVKGDVVKQRASRADRGGGLGHSRALALCLQWEERGERGEKVLKNAVQKW